MSTVASRTFRSSPHRDALATWDAIVGLLTRGRDTPAARELRAVAGIASSLIADRAPAAAPIVVTCEGPRTRIYCVYDDDALDAASGDESRLGFDPLQGDWRVSLPCPAGELGWIEGALQLRGMRISARDLTAGIAVASGATSGGAPLIIDLEGLLKP